MPLRNNRPQLTAVSRSVCALQLVATEIGGVTFFSPVMEIHDRYDGSFVGTPAWRRRREACNAYLLSLEPAELTVYPYFWWGPVGPGVGPSWVNDYQGFRIKTEET